MLDPAAYAAAEAYGPRSVFQRFRDSFSGGTLHDRWSIYKPASLADATVSGGRLRLQPVQGGTGATGSFWFSPNTAGRADGFLIYQLFGPAAGTPVGFDARIRCEAFDAAGTGLPPGDAGTWRFGGLAVHDPDRSTDYRYLHKAIGTEGSAGTQCTEDKLNRVGSVYPYEALPGDTLRRDLRIVRRATNPQIFDLFDRPWTGALSSSAGWLRRYSIVWTDGEDAADDFPVCPVETADPMPDDVQVGLIAYSSNVDHDFLLDVHEFWAGDTAA